MLKYRGSTGAVGILILLVVSAAFPLLVMPLPSVNAASTSLSPVGDTYADSGAPDTARGGLTYIIINPNRDLPRRGYVAFGLSSIPADATIDSALLYLYYYYYYGLDPGLNGRVIGAYAVTGSWSESALTWNNQPSASTSATSTAPVPTSYGWMRWDVRADVQSRIGSWALKDTGEGGTSGSMQPVFYTKEYGDSAYRPRLEVTYTVAPPASSTSLTISLSLASITLGSSTTISGSLTSGGTGLAGKSVTLKYSLDGGSSWSNIATVTTASDGSYTMTWTPSSAGSYEVKASFAGDASYSASESPIQVLTVNTASPPPGGPQPTTLTLTLNPISIQPGGSTTASGALKSSGAGVAGKSIALLYSLDQTNWNSLATATTASDGSYTFTVKAPASGTYHLKAKFNGDSGYQPSESPAATLTVGSGLTLPGDEPQPPSATYQPAPSTQPAPTPWPLNLDSTTLILFALFLVVILVPILMRGRKH